MNRILKRPMFRRGGSTGGITSGLRRGYHTGGDQSVDYGEISKRLNVPGAWKQAGEYAYQPRGTNVYDFMTETGLDLLTRPKAGNIFQQVAASAKGPYERFTARKGEADVQRYATVSYTHLTLPTNREV